MTTVVLDPEINVGDEVKLTTKFRTSDTGILADPTTVTLRLFPPRGQTEIVLTYAAADILRDGIGQYRYEFVLGLNDYGVWKCRWEGTGAIFAADQGVFTVIRPAS